MRRSMTIEELPRLTMLQLQPRGCSHEHTAASGVYGAIRSSSGPRRTRRRPTPVCAIPPTCETPPFGSTTCTNNAPTELDCLPGFELQREREERTAGSTSLSVLDSQRDAPRRFGREVRRDLRDAVDLPGSHAIGQPPDRDLGLSELVGKGMKRPWQFVEVRNTRYGRDERPPRHGPASAQVARLEGTSEMKSTQSTGNRIRHRRGIASAATARAGATIAVVRCTNLDAVA